MNKGGDRGRWTTVKPVKTTTKPGAHRTLLYILSDASRRHQQLWVYQNGYIGLPEQWSYRLDGFDIRLIRCDLQLNRLNQPTLSFPSLTDVRLDGEAITLIELIPFLRSKAPNLISFDFEYSEGEGTEHFKNIISSKFAQPIRLVNLSVTQVLRLRILVVNVRLLIHY